MSWLRNLKIGKTPRFSAVCFIFHLATALMIAEVLSKGQIHFSRAISFINKIRFFWGAAVIILLYTYYATNGRGERIFSTLQKKRDRNMLLRINPLLALFFIYVISFCICVLVAMYKNRDGIFT
jgi:hypothetical protein